MTLRNLFLTFLLFSNLAFSQSNHFQIGKDWLDLGEYEKAIWEFERALNQEPKSVEIRHFLVKAYLAQGGGWVNSALDKRQEILKINPKYRGLKELDSDLINYAAIALDSGVDRYGLNQYQYGVKIAEVVFDSTLMPGLYNVVKKYPTSQYADIAHSLLLDNIDSQTVEKSLAISLEVLVMVGEQNSATDLALFLVEKHNNEYATKYLIDTYSKTFIEHKHKDDVIEKLPVNEWTRDTFLRSISESTVYCANISCSFYVSKKKLESMYQDELFETLLKRYEVNGNAPDRCVNDADKLLDIISSLPQELLLKNKLDDRVKEQIEYCLSSKNEFKKKTRKWGAFEPITVTRLKILSEMTGIELWNESDRWDDYDYGCTGGTGLPPDISLDQLLRRIVGTKERCQIYLVNGYEDEINKTISQIQDAVVAGYKIDKYEPEQYIARDWIIHDVKLVDANNILVKARNEKKNQQLEFSVEYIDAQIPVYDKWDGSIKAMEHGKKWALNSLNFSG